MNEKQGKKVEKKKVKENKKLNIESINYLLCTILNPFNLF